VNPTRSIDLVGGEEKEGEEKDGGMENIKKGRMRNKKSTFKK